MLIRLSLYVVFNQFKQKNKINDIYIRIYSKKINFLCVSLYVVFYVFLCVSQPIFVANQPIFNEFCKDFYSLSNSTG